MRKVILFIAMSLDGFIADVHDNVDWLNGQNEKEKNMDTYSTFIKDVDTVIMGWNTYHQVVIELSPTEWVYADLISYVITHGELSSTDKIIFTQKNPSNNYGRWYPSFWNHFRRSQIEISQYTNV